MSNPWNKFDNYSTNPVKNFLLNYFFKSLMKLTEILLSTKIWIIFSFTCLLTYLLINTYIDPELWKFMILAIILPLVSARELQKVTHIFSNHKLESQKIERGEELDVTDDNK